MAIRLVHLKRANKLFTQFTDKEWELIHPEHYGYPMDWAYWQPKRIRLEAKEGKEIVGAINGHLLAGVMEIFELIIHHQHQGQGIGKMLLKEAENWGIQNGAHEVFLVTGSKWKAVDFYKKMGYQLVVELPNHYSKTDYVLFRKFLT